MRTALPLVLLAAISSVSRADGRADHLMTAALSLPDVEDFSWIREAVNVSLEEETDFAPAELLVSIMWGESRFRATERTGSVCGIMQVNPRDIGEPRSNCDLWDHDVRAGIRAGIKELWTMLTDRRVHGDVRLALLYRACGSAAFNGTCRKQGWPGWVLRRAEWLRSRAQS